MSLSLQWLVWGQASGPEMSVMDLAGGVWGLTCDCVFRGVTLCPPLTPADGLAPGKLLSHIQRKEEECFKPSWGEKICSVWGNFFWRLVFDFNMAYIIPFSGCFCLWRGLVWNITLSLYHYREGSLNTDTQQSGGIKTKHKRGIGFFGVSIFVLCSFMFNSIAENLLHEIFPLCCLKCFRSFSSRTKFVPWAFPLGRSTWKFSCESRASVSSSNK